MDDNEALSIINNFVEVFGLPVFVICNIDVKLASAKTVGDPEKDPMHFSRVLEKVVGWRIEVEPDLHVFLEYEINSLERDETKRFLTDRLAVLNGIIGKLDRPNLRSARLGIHHFATIDKVLCESVANGDLPKMADCREGILRRSLAGTIRSRQGDKSCSEVLSLIQHRMLFSMKDGDEQAKKIAEESRRIIDDYLDGMVSLDDSAYSFIGDLVDDGILKTDAIKRLCELWTGSNLTEADLIARSLSTDAVNRMEDADLDRSVSRCLELMQQGKYSSPESFRGLARNVLIMANASMTTIEECQIRSAIEKGVDSTLFAFSDDQHFDYAVMPGPAWDAHDKWVRDLISARMTVIRKEALQATAIKKLKEGLVPFMDWCTEKDGPCYREPLLAYSDPSLFWGSFLAMTNDEKCEVEARFRTRVIHKSHHYGKCGVEQKWLCESLAYMKSKLTEGRKGISAVHHTRIIELLEKYTAVEGDGADASN